MTVIICLECGAENELTAERCHQCDASLADVEPLQASDQEHGDNLPSAEDDLPGLLKALKNEENSGPLGVQDEENAEDNAVEPDESDQEDDIPDWLSRIRQRAQEEDAAGPITKKISSAEASLLDDNQENQHQSFESWIHQIQDEGQKEEGDLSETLEAEEQMPAWLLKLRKSQETPAEQEPEATAEESEQTMQMPGWIGTGDVVPLDGKPEEYDGASENSNGKTEDTIQVATSAAESAQEISIGVSDVSAAIGPVLSINPEEERQAEYLLETIAAENKPKTGQEKAQTPFNWLTRILFHIGLILIFVLIAIWGGKGEPSGNLLQPQNEAVLSWVEGLAEDAAIMVVMDAQAGFYSELSLVAKPVLNQLVTPQREFFIISSTPVGGLLFNRMINELGLDTSINTNDLGYFPVAAYGAFGMSGGTSANWEVAQIPQSDKALPKEDYDGIMILADSIMSAKAWVEQLSALMPENQIFLFLTAQAGPMLQPYWESGKVSGMIAGVSEAAGIETVLENSDAVADRWQLYQAGIWLMLIVLAVSPFMSRVNPKNHEGQSKQ